MLVVDASKATRTLAAHLLGCRAMDPDLALGGVILNRVATARQESLVREVMRGAVGVPVSAPSRASRRAFSRAGSSASSLQWSTPHAKR